MSDRKKMAEPKPGGRFRDTDTGQVVTYLGDSGHGPQWRAADGHTFYCDWLDYYLWGRFAEVRT